MAKHIRWTLAVVMLVAVGVVPSSAQKQPPHILFIVADDLGWNDVGWRDSNLHTPTIDRFARQGIILNNSYVQPLCTPSRSALMSGLYPIHTGLQHGVITMTSNASLPLHLTTLPEVLQSLGYATHMVGKWHLGYCKWEYTPTLRGFDSFLGYYGGSEDYYVHTTGGFGQGSGYDLREDKKTDLADNGTYSVNVFERRAMEIVAQHDMSKPLFLYLPFQSVHSPLQVPQMYEDMYCSKIKNATRRTMCGMLAAMDGAINNITGLMESRGFFDNTLMVFTADNGGPVMSGNNNWPLRGSKGTLWEGGTRAAAFVHSRTLLHHPGTVHDGMMHIVDWYPTLISLAGGKTPSLIDGLNQWKSISEGVPSPRTEFVYNMDDIPEFSGAIRVGDLKLIQGDGGRWNGWYPPPDEEVGSSLVFQETSKRVGPDDYQLFNIKDDPEERNDLKDKYPDILAKMAARLTELRAGMVPAQPQIPDSASDPKNYDGIWTPGWC